MSSKMNTLFKHKNPSLHYFSDQDDDDIETVVIRGVKTINSSKRLFFTPEKTNSILKHTTKSQQGYFSQVTCREQMISTLTMESLNPYMDFRSSMEEMVQVHGLHDWDMLEELLGCYLMLNEKKHHCYIIRAFADLVLHQLTTTSSDLSSPLHLSSTSTNGETSCCSSSTTTAPVEGGC